MGEPRTYAEKLEQMEGTTLLSVLTERDGRAVRQLAVEYRLTFQEVRQVAQAARDLEMWREESIADWWPQAERRIRGQGRQRKKALIRLLAEDMERLAASDKVYPVTPLSGQTPQAVRLIESDPSRDLFGRCAAYSDQTVCCGLHTIDAVMGCAFRCSYCTIQTFYGDTAELATDLAGRLAEIQLDADRFYHVGTGQASDSLLWGNQHGILDALCGFAERHPNVLLELKTKSDNVAPLLDRRLPANLVCSWSLNTETVIRNEEHGTASLDRRLAAARAVADTGRRVAFHFHPMVWYRGWRQEYEGVADRLVGGFSASEVAFLSMGTMTFIRPVEREIRRRGGETKVLQMEVSEDPHGKLTYTDETKIDLYSAVYERLKPWHGDVFVYFCMETASVWQAVLGHAFETNDLFEREFARRTGFVA